MYLKYQIIETVELAWKYEKKLCCTLVIYYDTLIQAILKCTVVKKFVILFALESS
jgi:hypothetical protein